MGVAGHMTLSVVTVMETCGLWGCILAGILAARLAQLSLTPCRPIVLSDTGCVCRYIYYNELDHHRLYIQMSADLFKVRVW